MNSIKVTPDELRAGAGKVDNEAAQYHSLYTNLLADVQTMTTTDWTGEDATTFYNQVEGFRSDFDKMRDLMKDYASFLRIAADNYQNTQEEVKRQAQSLAN